MVHRVDPDPSPGMGEVASPQGQSDVVEPAPGGPEEQQVAGLGRLLLIERSARPELLCRVPWKRYPLLGEDLLGKGRAVDPHGCAAAPEIGGAEQAPDARSEPKPPARSKHPGPHPSAASIGKLNPSKASKGPTGDEP